MTRQKKQSSKVSRPIATLTQSVVTAPAGNTGKGKSRQVSSPVPASSKSVLDENPLSSEAISFELSCLIKGDCTVFDVNVPSESKVTALKELVHEKRKRGLLREVDPADLVLLKVSSFKRPNGNFVAHFYMFLQVDKVIKGLRKDSLRQLSFDVGDPGVHELEELQLISECWTEQPANDKLSIFVKLREWLFALAYGH
jgi:hypothetical protein